MRITSEGPAFPSSKTYAVGYQVGGWTYRYERNLNSYFHGHFGEYQNLSNVSVSEKP